MQHDLRLRAVARAIFETVYPSDDWTPVAFEEAERRGTIHYRQAVAAASLARRQFQSDAMAQLVLL